MTKYKIIFTGTNGVRTVHLESPLELGNCGDAQNEDVANDLIDMGIELGYLEFGADFREVLDTYSIRLDFDR